MRLLSLLLLLLITGCAGTPPIDTSGVNDALIPADALAHPTELRGSSVLWGGVIIDTANLRRETRLEVLAYPLDGDQLPDPEAAPLRRFIAYYPGYLEAADYRSGRLVTVRGRLAGTRSGPVGEATYHFPVVEVERIHLWTSSPARAVEPQFHIGIGVLFGH